MPATGSFAVGPLLATDAAAPMSEIGWNAGIPAGKLHCVIVTAILASEHDLEAVNALMRVLRKVGVQEVARDYAVVGSQEINTLRFTLDGVPLSVEAETYVGLSVTGQAKAVETIRSRLRDIIGR
jgi:hypothetical protein